MGSISLFLTTNPQRFEKFELGGMVHLRREVSEVGKLEVFVANQLCFPSASEGPVTLRHLGLAPFAAPRNLFSVMSLSTLTLGPGSSEPPVASPPFAGVFELGILPLALPPVSNEDLGPWSVTWCTYWH